MPALSLPEPPGWPRPAETRAGAAQNLKAQLIEAQPLAARPGEARDLKPVIAPDPLDWKPAPSFRERILSAVGTPALVGVLIFAAAIVSAVILVLAQPHAPGDQTGRGSDSALVDGELSVGDTTFQSEARGDPAVSATLYVHVIGEVHSPGVVELNVGDRVKHALAAAGGVTKEAALEGVNLARVVSDGEQIVVPDSKEAAARLAMGGGAGEPTGGGSVAKVNLNTADAGLLESLPRVGPSLAERILEWREANGSFTSIEQLLEVSGIGQKTLEGFRDRVSI